MTVIVDTGVLVALIDPDTAEHAWAKREAARLPVPFLTSEAVLTEAAFLLARDGFDADELFELAESGIILVGLEFNTERKHLRALIRTYRDVPMSLADATLVRLSELHRDCRVFTLDSDFHVYRRHRSKVIPALTPNA
jgi:predicted nucleic acid-binding protein